MKPAIILIYTLNLLLLTGCTVPWGDTSPLPAKPAWNQPFVATTDTVAKPQAVATIVPVTPKLYRVTPAFQYPADMTNYSWSLQASTDFKNWATLYSWPKGLTNGGSQDVKITQPNQYFRMKAQ
jgi:hypothetical protein